MTRKQGDRSAAAVDPIRANEEAWALATEWGAEDRMSEPETLMWRSERHPRLVDCMREGLEEVLALAGKTGSG